MKKLLTLMLSLSVILCLGACTAKTAECPECPECKECETCEGTPACEKNKMRRE